MYHLSILLHIIQLAVFIQLSTSLQSSLKKFSKSHVTLGRSINVSFPKMTKLMNSKSTGSNKKLEDMSMEEIFKQVQDEKAGSKIASKLDKDNSSSKESKRINNDKEYENYWKRQESESKISLFGSEILLL